MARNRVIYQSEALYVSDTVASVGTGEHHQLARVQSANISYDLAGSRQDINQFGQLARLSSEVVDTPSVSLDLTYYVTNGRNEDFLGFYVEHADNSNTVANFASGHMVSSSGQNFFLLTADEGDDVNLFADSNYTDGASGYAPSGGTINGENVTYIGVGNGFLSDYTLDVAVGDFPTASVTIEGLNANAGISGYTAYGWRSSGVTGPYGDLSAGTFAGWGGHANVDIDGGVAYNTGIYGIENPAINPSDGTKLLVSVSGETAATSAVVLPKPLQLTGSADVGYGDMSTVALKPGDIVMNISSFDEQDDGPFVRVSGSDGICLQSASLSVPLSRSTIECLGTRFAKARVVDFPVTATLSVSAIVNEMSSGNLVDALSATAERNISITIKNADGSTGVIYDFKAAKFDAESFSSSIGPNKTVDLTFTTQVGGVNDTIHGVFMSGSW